MAAPESQAATPKPQKKYFVVSADCHVLEPPDLWERRIEAKFRHRLPRMERDSKGNKVLVVEGGRPTRIRDFALEGDDLERAKAGRPDLETRLRDLDRDGIDAEVIYPNRGLLMWASPDPAHQTAMCRVWNDWALEVFGPQQHRCAPVAAIAPKDVEPAVTEVQRVAKMGYRTVFLPVQVQDQPYNLPLYDPLWAAIQDTGMPISFHVGTGRDPRTATGNGGAILNYVVHALSTAIEPVVQLCASGVLERFPTLKVQSAENGTDWVPWFVGRLERAARRESSFPTRLSLTPLEYFHRQVYFSYIDEPEAVGYRDLIGEDHLMFAPDYPHTASTFPKSQQVVDRDTGAMAPDVRRKLVHDNVLKLFSLPAPVPA